MSLSSYEFLCIFILRRFFMQFVHDKHYFVFYCVNQAFGCKMSVNFFKFLRRAVHSRC